MKKVIFIFTILSILSIGCRQPILIPTIGSVEGKVVDIHNQPLEGVEIEITHVPASDRSEASEEKIMTETDFEGNFTAEDVWDEFRIEVKKDGFRGQSTHGKIKSGSVQPNFDFTLIGSPEQSEIILSRSTLSASDTIGLMVLIKVEDAHNEETSGYSGTLLVVSADGFLQTAIELSLKAEAVGRATLEAELLPESLPVGTYDLSAEISDPDGNHSFTQESKQVVVN